jgi:enterochelin esterase-like enzyme
VGGVFRRDLAGAVTVLEEKRPAKAAGTAVMVARHGRKVRKVVHKSKVLGVEKTFYVYLPDGVVNPRGARYPVVYFFRGHEDEWVNPRQDHSRRRRTVIDAYEELLHRGKVGPMVLVFPGMASSDNHISALLVNMKDPKRGHKGGLGTGKFEDYFVKELVPLVERSYPVRRGGKHRGVIGFSLGGLMAVKIALQHEGLVSSVGAYDGTFLWKDLKRDDTLRHHIFDAAFGVPRDFDLVQQNSPWHLLDRATKPEVERMRWFIEYGPEEAEPDDSNFYRGRELVKKLTRLGIKNEGGVVLHGHHDWQTADNHVTRTLPHHWRALS